jgi:hypothetical protein
MPYFARFRGTEVQLRITCNMVATAVVYLSMAFIVCIEHMILVFLNPTQPRLLFSYIIPLTLFIDSATASHFPAEA